MNLRCLALGLVLASALIAQAQDKMPVPVEDDTNAPPELRGKTPGVPLPGPSPVHPVEQPGAEEPATPYSKAMVAYKASEYQEALDVLKGVDPATQDDSFIILESKILTELKRYDDGEKLLEDRIKLEEDKQAAPAQLDPLFTSLGDLFLHKHAFSRAAKFYTTVLKDKPNDPDVTLLLIYTEVGENDLPAADKLAGTFSPFDPKHPYDDHPVYYFARAAIAQALGRTQDVEDDIQQARTNYGITVTNRYLKTYLRVFAAPDKKDDKIPSPIVPTPPAKP